MKKSFRVVLFVNLTFQMEEIANRRVLTRWTLRQRESSRLFVSKRNSEVMWTRGSTSLLPLCSDRHSRMLTNHKDKISRKFMMWAIHICEISMRCTQTYAYTARCFANAWSFFVILLLTTICPKSSPNVKTSSSTSRHHPKTNGMNSSWISQSISTKASWSLL